MAVGNHTLPAELLSNYDGFMYGMARWAYDVTNGYFWVMALLGFAMVLFMSTQRFGGARAFGFASVAGLLGALWLATLQLMPWWIASTFILVGVAGMVALFMNER